MRDYYNKKYYKIMIKNILIDKING